jgi:hypothetical protein
MRVTLQEGDFGTFLLVAENGRQLMVQADWDFPGLASTFGWSPCSCGETDGTVDCSHRTADDMIVEARDFLQERVGDTTDDPGYF